MGLIKTGLLLAGGFGLIKAASKAANEHEEKKQKRQNPSPQQSPGYEAQMSNMYGNQMDNHHGQAQPHLPYDQQQSHGNRMHESSRQLQPQSRSINQSSISHENTAGSPPPYYPTHPYESQGHARAGSAQEYYKSN